MVGLLRVHTDAEQFLYASYVPSYSSLVTKIGDRRCYWTWLGSYYFWPIVSVGMQMWVLENLRLIEDPRIINTYLAAQFY